jgi:hypothetical protein
VIARSEAFELKDRRTVGARQIDGRSEHLVVEGRIAGRS